jgi:hypothetical protein
MIDSQPDLAHVIRRVRGGYLKIQGTWMPFEVGIFTQRELYHLTWGCDTGGSTSCPAVRFSPFYCSPHETDTFLRVAWNIREDLIPLFGYASRSIALY